MGAVLIVVGIILSILATMFFIGGLFGNTDSLIIGFLFFIIGGVLIQVGKPKKKSSDEMFACHICGTLVDEDTISKHVLSLHATENKK